MITGHEFRPRPYNRRTAVTFEDTTRTALDRLVSGLRAHLEAELRTFTEELITTADADRARAATQAADAAAAEVRRQAHAQLSQLRDAAKKQTDELRRSAEAQVAEWKRTVDELRRVHQQELDATRTKAHADVEDARRMALAQVEDVQRSCELRLAEARREQDAVRRDAEELVIAQLAAAHADHEQKRDEAIDRVRTDGHQSELAYAARLLDAFRGIDEARTLSEILDALVIGAAREVDRVAVLLAKGDRLQGWRWSGFNGSTTPKSVLLTLDEAGLAGTAVRSGATVSRASGDAGAATAENFALPPFARDARVRHALALPIAVGGVIVAVVYADAPRVEMPTANGRWPAIVEVLTRHASRALEAVTVQQASGVAMPRSVARASHTSVPGPVEHLAGDGDEDVARRYARLLLSEVRMFNEPLVDAGRKSRDLLSRLGGEIERARRVYEARVPSTCARRGEFFDQELVRTLADGDRTLLGSLQ